MHGKDNPEMILYSRPDRKKLFLLSGITALLLLLAACSSENGSSVYANVTDEDTQTDDVTVTASETTVREVDVSDTTSETTEESREIVSTVTTVTSIETASETTTLPSDEITDTAPSKTSAVPVMSMEELERIGSSETSPTNAVPPKSTKAPEVTSAETTTVSQTVPAVSESAVTTAQTVQTAQTSQTAAAVQKETPSTEYSSDFFASDLFIDDSISTGYSLYGFLPEKNVYAKVGLNPSTVLTRNVSTCYGEIGVADMLAYTSPDRVYIMLGSNGIQWLSVSNMLDSTDTLVELIKDTCPDAEPVIISVPPVTYEYDCTVADVNVMEKINEYNDSLSAYCRAKGMLFVDIASVLKADNGYFDYTYAESDGMHFKSPAYKTLLSKIQTDVTDFLAYKEQAEALKNEADVTSSETGAETDVSSVPESSTTAAAEDKKETESGTKAADEPKTVTVTSSEKEAFSETSVSAGKTASVSKNTVTSVSAKKTEQVTRTETSPKKTGPAQTKAPEEPQPFVTAGTSTFDTDFLKDTKNAE